MINHCKCKACKKAARRGLVLGTRYAGFWLPSRITPSGKPEYYWGPVSDYVPVQNKNKPVAKFDRRDPLRDY